MRFRSYDGLRLFDVVARHLSFTAAAAELNLTKGAVSYQISRLETDLGFAVFDRGPRGVALTEKGERLRQASQAAFRDLDREIAELRDEGHGRITIAMATYFASRWLSPRLMTFISSHPQVALRVQPLINLIDLTAHDIDMAIRWGKGDWRDLEIEPLLPCPAFPTAGAAIAARVAEGGLEAVLPARPRRQRGLARLASGGRTGLSAQTRRPRRPRPQRAGPGGDRRPGCRLVRPAGGRRSDGGTHVSDLGGRAERLRLQAFRDWIVAEALG
jgi:DNA-binding transcriptional LysR family regulator